MRVLLAALFLAPVVTGCLAAGPSEIQLTTFVGSAQAGPGRLAAFVVQVVNTGEFRSDAEVRVDDVPGGWNVSAETSRLALPGGGRATVIINATPAADAKYGLYRLRLAVGDGATDLLLHVDDADAEEARVGAGARVFTAGFWDNGTIFYTNWREVRDNAGLASHSLSPGSEPAFDPLKVYVGGRRGERPPEPYNRTGYLPVIQGFDLALRGMRADETRAVRIPPDLAYTQPRNEEHPLYGDALSFVIHVLQVDVLPPDGGPPVSGVPCPPPVCA